MKDRYCLVADKNAKSALLGALQRPNALGIRRINFEVAVHSGRDPGARTTGPEILALQRKHYHHAFLMLDFEGSGYPKPNAGELEEILDSRLHSRWGANAKAIVIEPELDVWMWGASNALEQILQWPEGGGIRPWLRRQGFEFHANEKPLLPKEALEAVLRRCGTPGSSSIYQLLAERISLVHCTDTAFHRVRDTLRRWFANPGE